MEQTGKLSKGVEASKALLEWAEVFSKNDAMGELATLTNIDLQELAVEVAKMPESGDNDNPENDLKRQQLIGSIKRVCDLFVATIIRYGEGGEDQRELALNYINNAGDVVLYLDDICRDWGLEREFRDLLFTYGEVTIDSDFNLFLKRILQEKIEEETARQAAAIDPQLVDPHEFVSDLMEERVPSVTRTEIGGLTAAGAPVRLTGESRLIPSDSPPARSKLSPGHIPTARMGRDVIPRPDLRIPPAPPLPLIAAGEEDPEITISGGPNRPDGIEEAEERIVADRRIIDMEPIDSDPPPSSRNGQGLFTLLLSSDSPSAQRAHIMQDASDDPADKKGSTPAIKIVYDEATPDVLESLRQERESGRKNKKSAVPTMPPAPLSKEPSARVSYFNVDDIPPSSPAAVTSPAAPITIPPVSEDEFSSRITLVDLEAVPAAPVVRAEQSTVYLEPTGKTGVVEMSASQDSEMYPPAPAETPVPKKPSIRPAAQDHDQSPVVNFSTTQAPTIPAAEELAANDVDLPAVLPSSYKPGPSSRPPMKPVDLAPVIEDQPSPFTAAWAQQKALEAQQPSPGISMPNATDDSSKQSVWAAGNSSQDPLAPIGLPDDIELPSSYLQTLSGSARKGEQVQTAAENDRPVSSPEANRQPDLSATPDKIKKSTRSKILRWAGAAVAVLGMAGLVGLIKGDDNDQNNNTTPAGPSASAMIGPSAGAVASSSVDTPKAGPAAQAEKPAASERGIFRIDTKNPSFQAYLCHMKSASGLVSNIKSAAARAKVSYYQDVSEYQNAQKLGHKVMTGNETEQEQRIAVMEAFINHSLALPTDSHFIKNYFQHQKTGLENFKATGRWTQDALNYGVDKLYAAIQAPEKLTTSPQVVGYAPDPNPATNPGWKKVDSSAPTFGIVAKEAARQLHQPENAVAYDDFQMIKDATCHQIRKIGHSPADLKKLRLGNSPDVQNGVEYMYKHWCADDCAPENPLDRALKNSEPVYGEKVQESPKPENKPNTAPVSPTPTNIAPQPSHTELDRVLPGIPIWRGNLPAAPQPSRHAETDASQKEGFLARAVSKAKSFFGFGKKEAVSENATRLASAPNVPQATAAASQPEFTKKDIPMESWGKTLKSYFWG